jgi:hypothetical protein
MKKTLTIGMAVLALSLGSAAVVAASHGGAMPAANVTTADQIGEQGETQLGQGGEQGAVANGQNGEQGAVANGQNGDQGEKQNGQNGDGNDAATAAPKK